jgi:hypothetical protein
MAGMTQTSTSSFPKMGESGYEGLVNMSGDRSPYTKDQPRHGPTMPDTGGSPAGGRGSGMVHDTYGPAFRPVASRSFAPEYPETGRGMRTVPSAIGNRDFWAARAENGAGYDV